MVIAKLYVSKSTRPVEVRVTRHISRNVKTVLCIEEDRYPFHYWDKTGSWVSSSKGFAIKRDLFDVRSTRIITISQQRNHENMITAEMPVCESGS